MRITRITARPGFVPVAVGAALGLLVVAMLGLREFAMTDYEAEVFPAIQRLVDGDVAGFLARLPGYAGAVILQAPFALAGHAVGADADLWSWRAQALPGLLLLAGLGVLLGLRVAAGAPGRRGAIWGGVTAMLVAGSPFALLAQQTGHPEELLVAGLAVGAVLLAAQGRFVPALVVVAVAAAAKPWAAIAVPVVLVAVSDRRTLVRGLAAAAVAVALLVAPTWIGAGADRATAVAHASTTGIFKPANVFWFAGAPNPKWDLIKDREAVQMHRIDPENAAWAQRLESAWAARVSHPLIVAFAVLLAMAFWLRRAPVDRRGPDLLLLLAAVAWWRCLLDTWNVHYYALAALLALAAWEAAQRRPPVAALTVTLTAWVTFQIFPGAKITPDAHTALYLGWALPLGGALIWRALAPEGARRAAARLTTPLAARLPTLAAAIGPRG